MDHFLSGAIKLRRPEREVEIGHAHKTTPAAPNGADNAARWHSEGFAIATECNHQRNCQDPISVGTCDPYTFCMDEIIRRVESVGSSKSSHGAPGCMRGSWSMLQVRRVSIVVRFASASSNVTGMEWNVGPLP